METAFPLFAQPKGETFDPARDAERLKGQMRRVFELMRDGQWRTLRQIEDATGDPQASISARLRDMRRVTGWAMHSRPRTRGHWEYALRPTN